MSLVINNNLMANMALRNFATTYEDLAESVNKLSSGLRVNSADDDPAGMAVRELMRLDIAAYGQGIRNAQDAISMLQTFDGAAQTIDEKLTRMKELAEQAATGTYTTAQRQNMNDEYQAMLDEIERIANQTDFNGIKGLNSATGSLDIHFGPGSSASEDYITISLADMTSAAGTGLSLAGTAVSTQSLARSALMALEAATSSKDGDRANFGALINRLEGTLSNLRIQRENLQAAESRISDVDVASEMATMTRNQVLAQAGISMLAQANTIPTLALQLLGS
jgi:flagellin